MNAAGELSAEFAFAIQLLPALLVIRAEFAKERRKKLSIERSSGSVSTLGHFHVAGYFN